MKSERSRKYPTRAGFELATPGAIGPRFQIIAQW